VCDWACCTCAMCVLCVNVRVQAVMCQLLDVALATASPRVAGICTHMLGTFLMAGGPPGQRARARIHACMCRPALQQDTAFVFFSLSLSVYVCVGILHRACESCVCVRVCACMSVRACVCECVHVSVRVVRACLCDAQGEGPKRMLSAGPPARAALCALLRRLCAHVVEPGTSALEQADDESNSAQPQRCARRAMLFLSFFLSLSIPFSPSL
jgi:hypothetical protein